MRDKFKKYEPLSVEEENELRERIKSNPELVKMIIAARDHKPYIPPRDKKEDLVVLSTEETKSSPKQIKEEIQDRALSLLLFPTYENTVELIENLKAQDSDFIERATDFIEFSDNLSDIEAFRILKPTEEQQALWYEFKTALENYNKFNQLDREKRKGA